MCKGCVPCKDSSNAVLMYSMLRARHCACKCCLPQKLVRSVICFFAGSIRSFGPDSNGDSGGNVQEDGFKTVAGFT